MHQNSDYIEVEFAFPSSEVALNYKVWNLHSVWEVYSHASKPGNNIHHDSTTFSFVLWQLWLCCNVMPASQRGPVSALELQYAVSSSWHAGENENDSRSSLSLMKQKLLSVSLPQSCLCFMGSAWLALSIQHKTKLLFTEWLKRSAVRYWVHEPENLKYHILFSSVTINDQRLIN